MLRTGLTPTKKCASVAFCQSIGADGVHLPSAPRVLGTPSTVREAGTLVALPVQAYRASRSPVSKVVATPVVCTFVIGPMDASTVMAPPEGSSARSQPASERRAAVRAKYILYLFIFYSKTGRTALPM